MVDQVPGLMHKEIENVEGVEQVGYDHRVGDVAVPLLLEGRVGQIAVCRISLHHPHWSGKVYGRGGVGNAHQSPADDAGPAVVEELPVPVAAEAGVALDAH